jgi:phosphatidylglycerol---prolipoprotein diacylglyceryl transferase
MYPTLYHALYDLFGVDWSWAKLLNSFGFFVAIAFVIASYTLGLELKRMQDKGIFPKEKRKLITGLPPQWGDIGSSALMGFILGWKFLYLFMNSDQLFQPGSTPQRHIFSLEGYLWLGLLTGAAFGAARFYDYKKKQLPQPKEEVEEMSAAEYTGTITFLAAIGGLTGAKLFHLFENPSEFKEFFSQPSLESFISGLTVYGGLIVGAIVVLTWAWRKGWSLWHLCDAATPSMILGYGIGRIGCQVSGDGDWGIVNSAPAPSWLPQWLWSYAYPNNVNGEGIPLIPCDPHFEGYCTVLPQGVFPTPVYETTMALLIFGFLWMMRKKFRTPGIITGLYLVLNGSERLLIEQIRVNNKFPLLGMQVTQAEMIATLFILCGAAMVWWKYRIEKRTA